MIIFLVAVGFIIGVWFSSLFAFGLVWPIFILLLALAIFSGSFWFLEKEKKLVRLVALLLFCFALGSGRAELSLLNKNLPSWQSGQNITVEGLVAEEPKPGETTNQIILAVDGKGDPSVQGSKLLLITDLYPQYNYGHKLKVSGKLTPPKNFLTDSGREFDYANYLARQNIYFEIFRPKIELIRGQDTRCRDSFDTECQNSASKIRSSLIWIRQKIMSGISKVLPEPQAGLLGGLLLGGKQSMSKDLLEQFRVVGLSHMVVLSGYNLTIVAEAIRAVLSFLPLYLGLGAAGIGITLFALMAGGGAVVWRAALMALFAIVARATGRIYDVTRALIITIIALLLWDPNYLVFDLGFQLSILATLGLIFLSPLVKSGLQRKGTFFGSSETIPRTLKNSLFASVPGKFLVAVQEILATTIAAQLAVLPWLLYKMGQLSIVSFLVNPLALIVVPMIMLFGFLAGIISFISVWLAFIPGGVAYFLLSYQLTLVNFFSHLSFAAINLSSFPLIFAILIYAAYVYWYAKNKI